MLNNYDDANYTHYNQKSHPKMPGIAYFDKHVQPSGDDCVGALLTNVTLHVNLELILWKLGRGKFLESCWKHPQNRRYPTSCV